MTATLTVNRANNAWVIEPKIESWTYGEEKTAPQPQAQYGNVIVEYKLNNASEADYTTAFPENAGDYVMKARVLTTNYVALEKEIKFSIFRKELTNVALTHAYNGKTKDIEGATISSSYGVVNSDTVTATISNSDDSFVANSTKNLVNITISHNEMAKYSRE